MAIARRVEQGIEMRINGWSESVVVPLCHSITVDSVIGTKVRLVPNTHSITIEAMVGPGAEVLRYAAPIANDDRILDSEVVPEQYGSVEHFVGDCLVQANGRL